MTTTQFDRRSSSQTICETNNTDIVSVLLSGWITRRSSTGSCSKSYHQLGRSSKVDIRFLRWFLHRNDHRKEFVRRLEGQGIHNLHDHILQHTSKEEKKMTNMFKKVEPVSGLPRSFHRIGRFDVGSKTLSIDIGLPGSDYRIDLAESLPIHSRNRHGTGPKCAADASVHTPGEYQCLLVDKNGWVAEHDGDGSSCANAWQWNIPDKGQSRRQYRIP